MVRCVVVLLLLFGAVACAQRKLPWSPLNDRAWVVEDDQRFAGDKLECWQLTERRKVGSRGDSRVEPLPELYEACMKSRGWRRK